MIIPDRVKVAGQIYTVKRSMAIAIDHGNAGQLCPRDNTITISEGFCEEKMQQIFIHELVEAINEEYKTKLEHHQIEQLESAIYQVIVDNPEIFICPQETWSKQNGY